MEEYQMKVELCMGSSCFSRGNARVLEVLEAYASENPEIGIELSGHLCLGECSCGPNVRVDGTVHHGLDSDGLIGVTAALTAEREDE